MRHFYDSSMIFQMKWLSSSFMTMSKILINLGIWLLKIESWAKFWKYVNQILFVCAFILTNSTTSDDFRTQEKLSRYY